MFYTASKKRRPDHTRPRTGYGGNPSSVFRTPTLCMSDAPLDENKLHTRTRKPRQLINPRFSTLDLQHVVGSVDVDIWVN
jgi:hypothetical protein